MSLYPCPACAREISQSAKSCPHCGHPLQPQPAATEQKETQPKPIDPMTALGWGTVIVLLLLFSMISKCGTSSEEEQSISAQVAVKSWLNSNLKDPDSFQAIEWGLVEKGPDGLIVRCKYRAKNSFGGYVIEERLFRLNTQGEVVSAIDLHDK